MLETCNFVKPQNFSWFHWLNDVLQVPAVWEAVRWRVLPGRELWPRRPHSQLSARRPQSHRLGLIKGTVPPVLSPVLNDYSCVSAPFFCGSGQKYFSTLFLTYDSVRDEQEELVDTVDLTVLFSIWLVQKLLCKLTRTYVMCMLFQEGATCEKKSFNILGWWGGR